MKPIVLYRKNLSELKVGIPVITLPVDHPSEHVSNTGPARTSVVIRIDDSEGEFETMNTIYRLAEE